MSKKTVFVIKFGCVEYIDLCVHENVSRSDFFNNSDLKTLRYYGLVLEDENIVKCYHCDDVSDDSEGAGIVIPRSCVVSITYFKEDYSESVPTLDINEDIN